MTQETIVDKRDRRESRGRVIALSRTVYHITGKNVYYVESESEDGIYYYIMWNTEKEIEWCSCVDHSMRGKRCKHIFAIEYAIRGNTIKETDKLPTYKKVNNQVQLDYEKDAYTF